MSYSSKPTPLLHVLLAQALRRARNARGPSAAQAADRTAARIRSELKARARHTGGHQ